MHAFPSAPLPKISQTGFIYSQRRRIPNAIQHGRKQLRHGMSAIVHSNIQICSINNCVQIIAVFLFFLPNVFSFISNILLYFFFLQSNLSLNANVLYLKVQYKSTWKKKRMFHWKKTNSGRMHSYKLHSKMFDCSFSFILYFPMLWSQKQKKIKIYAKQIALKCIDIFAVTTKQT